MFLFLLLNFQDSNTKARLEAIEKDAHARIAEGKNVIAKDQAYFQRRAVAPVEPIFIASTEGLGTSRVRANHYDAVLDFYSEQEKLKAAGAPLH